MISHASTAVRRSLLYVPASSPRFLEKTQRLTCDTVAYDLEDSVTAGKKAEARRNIVDFLTHQKRPASIREISVRVNSVSSTRALAEQDLKAVLPCRNVNAIVVPKVNRAEDVRFVHDMIVHHATGRTLKILALIESAEAIMNLSEICQASPHVDGLIFAAEDFALDLSLTRTPSLSEFLYARSAMVTAARAYRLPSAIDLVCTAYAGASGQDVMRDECNQGKGLGFNGKQCIHPEQLRIAEAAFSPSRKELDWASKIVAISREMDAAGKGAFTVDGKMIDAPVVSKAHAIVARAELCGMNVEVPTDSIM